MIEYRIFGPPGTGKTTRLVEAIGNAHRQFHSSIMVASFTRAAAAELVGRDLPIPKDRVGTLHSFAHRALSRPEIANSPSRIREWNAQVTSRDWLLSTSSERTIDDPMGMPRQGDLLSHYSRLRNLMVPLAQMPNATQRFASAWNCWKRENDLLDFTDLIEMSLEFPLPFPSAVGFFDEVQDCTPLELCLIRKWASQMQHVVLAGDDDQAIYGFRGAVPDGFLEPAIPDKAKTVLAQSFRLPAAIKSYADQWIRRIERREAKEFDAFKEGGEIQLMPGLRLSEADGLAEAAARAASDGSVMLLASCGFMLDATIGALRRRGLPFHNPYRRSHGGWNPMRGGAERLSSFLADEWTWKAVWNWLEHVDQKKAKLRRGFKKDIKEMAGDEERCEQRVQKAEWGEVFGDEFPWHHRNPDWLEERLLESKRRLYDYPFRVLQRHGQKALMEEPRVVVGTVHSVKGGEADSVILAPDLSTAALAEAQQLGRRGTDSVVRLFYVGMTRARERLMLLEADSDRHARLPRPRAG